MTGAPPSAAVAGISASPPPGWDALAVEPPGGNVHQGLAWAAHRAGQGWRPRYVTFTDGRVAMVLTRSRAPLPGFIAYAPRGPIAAGDDPEVVAGRVVALAERLREEGASILAADPELAADPAYEAILRSRGFRETEELQAERNRMVLTFPEAADVDTVYGGVSKSTRQRIRAAERAGLEVRLATDDATLAAFAQLYEETARRRAFWIGDLAAMVRWWRRAIDAGQAMLLSAARDDRLFGGLLIYRQGGRLATAYSADDASTRDAVPGTMHLLRWEAIRRAVSEGHRSIDLGGVDLPGARRIPEPGEPTYGLYQHKRSFGAEWVECAPAHEVVLRPVVNAAATVVHRAGAVVRRRRPPA